MRGSSASAVAATVNAFIILVEYPGRRGQVRSGAPRAALPPRRHAGNMNSTKEENMHRSLGILVTGLFVSASCFAQGALVGTYKLVSIKAEIDGKLRDDRSEDHTSELQSRLHPLS